MGNSAGGVGGQFNSLNPNNISSTGSNLNDGAFDALMDGYFNQEIENNLSSQARAAFSNSVNAAANTALGGVAQPSPLNPVQQNLNRLIQDVAKVDIPDLAVELSEIEETEVDENSLGSDDPNTFFNNFVGGVPS